MQFDSSNIYMRKICWHETVHVATRPELISLQGNVCKKEPFILKFIFLCRHLGIARHSQRIYKMLGRVKNYFEQIS